MSLLPPGFSDQCPPDARQEWLLVIKALHVLQAHGYALIKPPALEYEETLLKASGAGLANRTFRIMDPVSHAMMGVRADITPQIARVSRTRLANAPRPLRLCYEGQVFRTMGSQLRPERQFKQVGCECIGSDDVLTDVEVILLAAKVLQTLGIPDITIDLNIPTLVRAVFDRYRINGAQEETLRAALQRLDCAVIAETGAEAADILCALIACCGPAETCAKKLAQLPLEGEAAHERDRLLTVLEHVQPHLAHLDGLHLSLDLVEQRGFDYQTGVSFTLLSAAVMGELGRGGRYHTDVEGGETATGVTFYMDSLLIGAPKATEDNRLYLPRAAAFTPVTFDGAVVQGHADGDTARTEARRLGCTHIYDNGNSVETL